MKTFSCKEKPFKIYGVPFFEENKDFRRFPEELIEESLDGSDLGRRTPGARLAFKTDAKEFDITVTFKTFTVDIGMSIYGCQSCQVLLGSKNKFRYLGIIGPKRYDALSFTGTVKKNAKMEELLIFLPRNEIIEDITLTFPDNAKIEEPTPYKYEKPVIFFGSSITEGGCACNLFNTHSALLSNRLDFDFYNFGFSSRALGQIPIAKFIASFDMSAFVYDYDYNAPNGEHLKATHEPFFNVIREAHPKLPIIMISRPAPFIKEEVTVNRDIIKQTYENEKAKGDDNVYFIDGSTFFADKEPHCCTIDGCHPNDYGFHLMADKIEPILKEALIKHNGK